jgi:hypothetical protein
MLLDTPSESQGRFKDRDTIHTLSSSALPIRDVGLRRTRLIKNARLETRVELFAGSDIGSGQILVEDIPDHFHEDEILRLDMDLLSKIAELPSLDFYTLRWGLRKHSIDVDCIDYFRLSDEKVKELQPFMAQITRPLSKYLYGNNSPRVFGKQALDTSGHKEIESAARIRLMKLAESLEISINELPDYLEKFGDVYLAYSFFQSYFKENGPKINQMKLWADDAAQNSHLQRDEMAQETFSRAGKLVDYVYEFLEQRFERLSKIADIEWEAIDLDGLQKIQKGMEVNQIYLASGVCGLAVKVYEWEKKFPNASGSPDRCLDFVSSDLMPGLDILARSLPRSKGSTQLRTDRTERAWN